MKRVQCMGHTLLAILFLWASPLRAEETAALLGSHPYQWYGFVTQGAFYARNNNYFGQSNGKVSFDFRELGLGGNFNLTPRQRLAGLLLSRDAGETDNASIRIDHLLLDSQWATVNGWQLSSQLGRIKIPLGLLNETRDVAATRPSILLPQSLYFDNARRFLINAEGIKARAHLLTNESDTSVSVAVLVANGINNPETESYFLGTDHPGHLTAKPGAQIRLVHTRRATGTTLLAEYGINSARYLPSATDYLSAGRSDLSVYWLSLRQDWYPFEVRTEMLRINAHRRGFGPVIPDSTNYAFGWYGEANYTWRRTEAFLRYDVSYVDLDDKSGTALAKATNRPAYDFFARDWTTGVRYHVTSSVSVSMEYHYVDGTGWLPIADNKDPSERKRYWHLLATQLAVSF